MDFPGHFTHIFQQLNYQRIHGQLCDCLVLVGGQSFQAHRSILAACSSHFRALLSSTEGDEVGGTKTVHGDGPCVMEVDPEVVTPDAFSTLLDMIYTSTLTLGTSNVMDVLLAASHLHLNTVVKACKLHLSKRDFPTSPPKGWRSVQQQKEPSQPLPDGAILGSTSMQLRPVSPQHLQFSLNNKSEARMEVSQSGGVVDDTEMNSVTREQIVAPPARCKRKSPCHEDGLNVRKRRRPLRENYGEHSPTVTRSTSNREVEEELSSTDSPQAYQGSPPRSGGVEQLEEKYEATKREYEEIELPSQSDSDTGGVREGAQEGGVHSEAVVKIKVGEEKEEDEDDQNMVFVEVKKENTSSSSEVDPVADRSPSRTGDSAGLPGDAVRDEKMATTGLTGGHTGAPTPPLCTDPPHADTHVEGGTCEEPTNGEGLDSLSELAFSCFLNPSSESVMGALEVEESLASLTAAAADTIINDAPGTAGDVGDPYESSDAINTSTSGLSDCSSLVFPVATVPLQQLLSTQAPGFSDTLLLQSTQSSLGGFLRSVRPALSLQTTLLPASSTGKNRGCGNPGSSGFRRIAPKTAPGSEAGADSDPSSSSGSAGDAAHRPALTRASEEVMSKCKKAATEDHVLLVEGEKKYACTICCKTFMNLSDCKKHIRVHTGEKPYPCPKCGKRFSQSSHLYKHSKNTCLHWKGDQQPSADCLL